MGFLLTADEKEGSVQLVTVWAGDLADAAFSSSDLESLATGLAFQADTGNGS